MGGAVLSFIALTGWVLGTVRVCRYMIDNPPRYAPDEYR